LSKTGAIGRLAGGKLTTFVPSLPSAADFAGASATAAGPSSAFYDGKAGNLVITMQDASVQSDGTNSYGSGGVDLGHLVSASPNSSTLTPIADLAKFASQNQQTAATDPHPGTGEEPYDSDPYDVVPYQGGYAVADAAANDVLFVSPTGSIQQLAQIPAQTGASNGSEGVPTSLAVGPDGALYVGELVGIPGTGPPSVPGTANVYRVVPGQAPTVYATGFTAPVKEWQSSGARGQPSPKEAHGGVDATRNHVSYPWPA
jgi:hypothetical protein